MEDYLGKAAHEKQSAKIAIKEKRFNDAWRHLNNQKDLYLKHAHRMQFSEIHTLVIDSSPHEDMANILRLEGKHKNALSNISYTYKAAHLADRPTITLEKKLEAYYNRAYKKQPFKRFLSLLKALPNGDIVSVRDFVEIYYPMAPAIDDDQAPPYTAQNKIDIAQEKAKSINSDFFEKREQQKAIASTKVVDTKKESHPEPKYADTASIKVNQKSPNAFLGYSNSDWILNITIGAIVLVIFIWLIG